MRSPLIVPILAAMVAVAAPLAAQQAAQPATQPTAAAYDQTAPITLEGTADTIEWADFGGKLVLAPTTGTQMWDIALPDTGTMVKKGISANLLTRGVPVKVDAYKAKDTTCDPHCKAQGVRLTINGGQTFDLLSPVAPDPTPAAGAGGGRGRRGG
jgi:hypothetical protein